ncbi:MAG: hypothetical protein KY442_14010, partial [Proteobacteria bacterium]|nr:hypothetical protein [Pseudomonadota bacterium]
MYRLFVLSISTCLLALAACTAPMQGDGDAARARLAAPDAPAEASTPPAGRQAPPMSDPLPPQTRPPQRVPDDAAAPQTAPAGEVTLDRSCRRDADCTIKN